jgi:hypothetical protein
VQAGGSTDGPVGIHFSMENGAIIASDKSGMMNSISEPVVESNSKVSFTPYAQTVNHVPGPFCGVVSSDYSTSLE